MPLFGLVLFICGCLWLFCSQAFSNMNHEPLVREGRPYYIYCKANLSLTDWDILWIMNNSVPIARCDSKLGCLSAEDKQRFQAKMERTDLISVLTIQNVTWNDRGQSFTCHAFEKNNGSRRQILGVWSLSRTYLPPDPPLTCEASLQEGQIIHLSCRTDKVYPDISCQPVQIFDVKKTSLDIPMHYDTSSYNQEYYSATCSGNIFPYVPGVYLFCVNSTTAALPNEYSCTNTVTITNRTTVRIAHDMGSTVKLCQGEDIRVSIKCEVLWWLSPERPTVSCSIGDKTKTNRVIIETNRSEPSYSRYVSLFSFLPTSKHDDVLVKCSVLAKNGTQAVSAEANITLSYSPSKPPRFVYTGSEKTEQTTFYLSTNTNVTVECTVEDEPLNPIVTVECVDVFLSETYRLTQKHNAELSFIFHNDTNCTCTADYGYNCTINPAAKLIFVADKRHIDVSWVCLTFHCLRYFLLVIPVGICVLLILVLCWRARHEHSDTSFYSCFKIPKLSKQTSFHDNNPAHSDCRDYDVSKSEVSPYLVVDIVDQNCDFHGNSNSFNHLCPLKQYQSSKTLQNCHRLPRRKPPPLPVTSSIKTSDKTVNNYFGFDYQNNRIGLTASANSINATEVAYGNLMSNEELPPLPPRLGLHTEQKLLETSPLSIRNDQIKVNTTLPSFQQNSGLVNIETYCYNYQDNVQSLPRRPPPPVPCGLGSLSLIDTVDAFILENTKDGLTLDGTNEGLPSRLNSHTNRVVCEIITSHATAERHEPTSGTWVPQFQQIWPPPPFKARRQTCKKRNVHKCKMLRHPSTRMVSANLDEVLEGRSNAQPDDVVNTYVNLKTEPLLTKQNIHDMLVPDDMCDSEDDCSSRSDVSDVCSSLLTSEESSTCSSTSTTVEVTRDGVSSDTEGSLL